MNDLLDRVRQFVADECVPLEPLLLAHDYAGLAEAMGEVRARAKAGGLWNLALHSDHGGAGLALPEFGRVSEALGWSPLGHWATNGQAPDIGNMELLLAHATADQRERFFAARPGRRRAVVLCHDRARARRLQPDGDVHDGPSGRRRR